MGRIYGFLFLFAVATTVFFSCKKEPAPKEVSFTNITETDSLGNINGTVDTLSWTADSTWTATEQALLYFTSPGDTINDTLLGSVSVAPAYPNPSDGVFSLRVSTSQQCFMKVAIVNTAYEILYYNSRIMWGGPFILQYDVSGFTAFHRPGYYRMYYGFYNSYDSLYFKGHGNLYFK